MLRFAPSPTGDMNIGNLRVAIINYIVAKQKNEQFLVRIDDTHSQRNIEGIDTEIMMLLEKFAIEHDSVYHQSEHLGIHQNLAIRLLQEGKAFVCRCTEEELQKDRYIAKREGIDYHYSNRCEKLTAEDYTELKESNKPFVIRIKKPKEDIVNDDILKGSVKTVPNKVDSFIIMRTDKTPTYNFACACDDMLSDISFIIRGEKNLRDTPKQMHIKTSLGYENDTAYAHLPIILNRNGKKMSRRDEISSITWLLKEGFLPDAILNYLLLLGNSKAPKEIFTLPEAIEWFDLNSISSRPVNFEIKRLRLINREHLRLIDDKKLSTLVGFADADIGKLAKLYLKKCSTVNELEAKIRPIFQPKKFNGKWGKKMRIIERIIEDAPLFDTFNKLKKYIAKESGLKDENLLKPLRILLTGANSGPELSEIYPLIKFYLLEVAS
jgi:glutamyl-tRNA synthetase